MADSPEPAPIRPSNALRGRAIGIMIGSLMAFGWAFYAANALAGSVRIVALLIAVGVTAALLIAASAMSRAARSAPDPTAGQRSTNRRAWLWFSLNFIGEVVLLNIAIGLLAAPDLRIYWVPAISVVVGLHFFPMAMFFRTPSYWWVGAAMILAAAIAAYAVAQGSGDAAWWVHGEGAANAVILWSALAAGAFAALRASSGRRS